jgi:hypothetical protein
MEDLRWNNIPLSDFVDAMQNSEVLWKSKVGVTWPNADDIELIMHVSAQLQLLRITKYTSIR